MYQKQIAEAAARANARSRVAISSSPRAFTPALSVEESGLCRTARGAPLTSAKNMPWLVQEAARELFLFNLGVRSPADIVRWVDAVIAKVEAPHQLLIELSTTPPERLDRFISVLSDLRRGSDFWSAVRDAMPALHGFVVAHPEEAERIARQKKAKSKKATRRKSAR